jgi:hypothetical protein
MSEATNLFTITNEMRNDEPIMRVEGTLIKLYPVKNTPHGTLQNGELSDGENVQKVTFADVAQPMSARNQYMVLECTHSDKHGWVGVKVKDDQQFGRAIWVTPTAAITFPRNGGGAPAQTQTQEPPRNSGGSQRRPQQEPRQPNQGNAANRRTQPAGGGKGAPAPSRAQENQFEAVERFADCYEYCFNLVNEKLSKRLPTPENPEQEWLRVSAVQRATATIFVDVAKSGVAATWNPNLKLRRFPAPPSDPNEWRQCYIDKEGSALDGKTLEEVSDEDLLKLFKFYDLKQANHPLAECVYQASKDRGLLQSADPDVNDMSPDDIPF